MLVTHDSALIECLVQRKKFGICRRLYSKKHVQLLQAQKIGSSVFSGVKQKMLPSRFQLIPPAGMCQDIARCEDGLVYFLLLSWVNNPSHIRATDMPLLKPFLPIKTGITGV